MRVSGALNNALTFGFQWEVKAANEDSSRHIGTQVEPDVYVFSNEAAGSTQFVVGDHGLRLW